LLEELETDMEAALADIRRLVYDLRPPALDELGLAGAIRETAACYDTNGLSTSVDAPERLPALSAAVEVAVYRIVGEALANVVRHANARSCAVRLSASDVALLVEVSDDGVGLSAGGARAPGVGLYSMRERAEELGGSCRIESPPAGGTRVFARLPLEASSFGQRATGKSKESVAEAPGFPTRDPKIDPGVTKTRAKNHEEPKPDA
jgi:signal transduction histidine kinase